MANQTASKPHAQSPARGFPAGAKLGRPVDVVTFEGLFQNSGFDGAARPNPWLMVPQFESAVVRVNYGGGLQVRTDREDILEVIPSTLPLEKSLLVVKSRRAPGKGKVFVGDFGRTLDVSVKRKVEIHVAFYYVNRGPAGTGRDPVDLDSLVMAANAILEPQANVVIKIVAVADPFLPIPDLPTTVTYKTHWDIVTKTSHPEANFNVYFVQKYIGSTDTVRRPGVIRNTLAETQGNRCIFEDNLGREVAITLAHEVVHRMLGDENETALGFRDGHSLIADELMFAGTNYGGRKIPKAQVDLLNPD
jgi:hypothetical protein